MPPAGTLYLANAETLIDAPEFGSGSPGNRSTSYSRMSWTTDATSLDVVWYSTLEGYPNQAGVAVYVDGAHLETLTPDAYGVLQTDRVTLPVGTKVVDVVNGPTSNIASGAWNPYGSWVAEVYVNGANTISPIHEDGGAARIVLIGDSKTAGFNALHPTETSWSILLRGIYNGDSQVTIDANGGQRLFDIAGDGTKVSAFVAKYAAIGSVSRFVLLLGTNDWSGGSTSSEVADWAGSLIDAIHTEYPLAKVDIISPFIRTGEDGGAEPLSAFRTALAGVASARSAYCRHFSGLTMASADDLDVDGLHFKTSAQQGICNAVYAALES